MNLSSVTACPPAERRCETHPFAGVERPHLVVDRAFVEQLNAQFGGRSPLGNSTTRPILERAVAGERLSNAEALQLLQSADLTSLGVAANAVTMRLHPEPFRTFNIDRNVNYTNVCSAVCDFCAFFRRPKSPEGYVLPKEVIFQKIEETVALGGDQILMQGGMNPELPIEWYEDLLRSLKERFPKVNLHAFSPPEVYALAKLAKLPIKTVLQRLKDAGLGSLPGGGGEILVDRVRKEITRGKVLSDDWIDVCRQWHELGENHRRR